MSNSKMMNEWLLADYVRQRGRVAQKAPAARLSASRSPVRTPEQRWQRRMDHLAAYRARIRGAGTVESVSRAKIIERDQSVCHICGEKVPPRDVHLDHIVPLAAGGDHTEENLAVAHSRCNMLKGARPLAA